ncbi:hypothetical protein [Streptomyces syringium]|uniref:hypothetical protein n=1 Tax=Streptomyces syringium TaxID=76729 RepID=UPI0037D0F0BD
MASSLLQVSAQHVAQLGVWHGGSEPPEEFLGVPGDQATLAGEVQAYFVDAELVGVVEQQVSGELVDLLAA